MFISAFQLVRFKDKRKKYTVHLCKLSYHISKKIEDALTINVLVCGNVFSDGENGMLWSESLDSVAAMDEAENVVKELKKSEKVSEEASVVLFKEFWSHSSAFSDRLKQFRYRDFMIDVNMVLKMHPEWNSFDSYLSSMKTKFRTRAKGTLKKSEALVLRPLSSTEIIDNKERITELFGNVLEKSDFSYGAMTADTFAHLKESIPESFELMAVFQEEALIGFSTSFLNGSSLEANFVGLDYDKNNEFGVYQRLLLNYVIQGIDKKVTDIQFGRTAELMKSQIGAVPENMRLYIKHHRSLPNMLLKPIIESIAPREFELRPPFKSDYI